MAYEQKTIKPDVDVLYHNDKLQIIAEPYSPREWLETPDKEGE